MSVSSGAAFNYLPAPTGTMTLASGSTLTLANNSTVGLAFGDTISVSGAASVTGSVNLNLSGAFSSGTQYTLLSAGGGLPTTPSSYVLNPTNFTYTLSLNGNSVLITPTTATALATAYWLGTFSSSPGVWAASNGSSASNWASSPSGTPTPLVPGPSTNVIFSATGAQNQGNMSLGSNMSVNSLTVNGTTATPNETNALTLAGTGGYTLAIGSTTNPGIAIDAGSGAVTLNPGIILGVPQTWTNNSSNTFSVTGGVTAGANLLTFAGSGATTVSGSSAFTTSGGLTVNSGTVTISEPIMLGGVQTWTNNSTNTLAITGGVSAGANLLTFAGSGNTTISGASAFTTSGGLTVNSGAVTISEPITLGGAQTWTNNSTNTLSVTGGVTAGANLLTFAGSGATTISGSSAFTTSGGLTVNSGTVTISEPVSLGQPQTWTNNSTNALSVTGGVTAGPWLLTFAGSGATTVSGSSAFTTSGGLTINTGTGAVTISEPVTLGQPQTWTNNSTNTLSVSGGVTAGGNLLTFAGSGATTISGTSGLTTSAGLTVNSGAGAVTISEPLTLGAAQTWTNNSSNTLSATGGINAGANQLTIAGSGATTISGASAFTTSAGVTVNSGAGAFTVNAPVTLGASQSWTNNSSNTVSVGGAIANAGNTLTIAGSGNTAISGAVSGTGGLTLTGANAAATLTLASSANAYTGATTINSGTVTLGANNAIPTASAVTMGFGNLTFASSQTSSVTLNLNGFNQSLASLTAPSYASANTVLDTITVNPGNTLTLTGSLSLGFNTNAATPTETGFAHMVIGGGGSLVTTGTATWQIGNDNQTVGAGGGPAETATLDLTGLASANINLGTTGTLTVSNPQSGNDVGSQASLLLPTPSGVANTAPTTMITAATINVGVGSGNNDGTGQINSLVLGTGLTTLNTNTLNIGATANRDIGSVAFAGANGDITLRAANGTGAVAVNMGTGGATTGVLGNLPNLFDISGHYADLLISTLDIGNQDRTASLSSTFKFDTGLLSATGVAVGYHAGITTNTAVNTNTVDLGYNASWSDSGISTTPVGTVTIGTGGLDIGNSSYVAAGASQEVATVNIGTGDTVTIANSTTLNAAIRLATNSATSGAGSVTATLNILGGSLTVTGNIIGGTIAAGGTGANTSTLTLNGGTLNMSGFNIGSSATVGAGALSSLNFQSGILENVGTINSTGGLIKTTTGTLLLTGTSGYTGATTVNAGTLTAQTTSDATSSLSVAGSATFNYASTAATPAGFNLTGAAGNTLTLASGSAIGATIGSTLTNGAISLASAATASTTGSIAVNIEGDSAVTPATGTYTLINAPGGGLLSTNGSTASYSLGTIYNATNFTVSGGLILSDTAIQIGIVGGLAPLATEYWNGGFSGGANVWSASDGVANSNWSTVQSSYTPTSQTPGPSTTVVFSDSSPTGEGSMTLGAPVSILGLVSNDPAALVLNLDSINNTLTIGTGGITLNSGAGGVTLNVPVILSGSQSWTNSTTANTLSVTNGVATAGFTLTTAGLTSIAGGLTGGGSLIVSTGQTTISGGTSSLAGLSVGNGGIAAVYQASGAKVTITGAAGNTDLPIGNASSGYGYYGVPGGTLTTNQVDIGAGAGSTGILDLSVNSVFADPGFLNVAPGGAGATGELNVSGTTAVTLAGTAGTAPKFALNGAAGNTSIVNLISGTITGPATGTTYTLDFNAAAGNGTSIVNLNGGTLQIAGLIASNASTNPLQLNFNGGTLKATVANANFFGNVLTGNPASGASIYGNGGTIDNNGVNVTVAQVIKSPTGNGVSALALPSGDSGYIAPPLVTISGGSGTGATAIANISGGAVTGFTITNPGTGYTGTPTYALSGGGGTPGTAGAVTTTANTTGNVTYTDSSATNSTTTISGANTYTGNTFVTGAALVNATAATAFGIGGTIFLNSTEATAGDVLSFTPTIAIVVSNPITLATNTGRENIASNTSNVTLSGLITLNGTGVAGTQVIYNNTANTTLLLNGGITGTGYTAELSFRPTGNITVSTALTLASTAIVDTNVGASTVTFSGPSNGSTWGGTEFLETGTTVALGNSNVLPTATFLYGNGGATLDMEGFNQAVTSLQANLLKITNNNTTAGNPSTLNVNIGTASQTFTGTIADGAANKVSLVLNGTTGTQSIGFTNFTGGITVNGGTLSVNANNNASAVMVAGPNALTNPVNPADALTLNGGTFQLEGRNTASTTTLANQSLTGAAGLNSTTQIGLTSSAGLEPGQGVTDSTVSVDIAANSYIVAITGNTIFLNNPIPNTATGQTLNFTAATTSTTAQTFNSVNVTAATTVDVEPNTSGAGTTLTFSALAGSGNLTKIGPNTLLISGANSAFTGNTILGAGPVQLLSTNALQASTVNATGTGTLAFDSGNASNAFTLGGLSGSTNQVLQNNAATPAPVALTVGANGQNTTYSGILSDAGLGGSLIKSGSGVFTLTGGNTYSGGTTVSAGVLLAGNASPFTSSTSAIGTGSVTVSTGGTLGGSGSIAGPATVNSGGFLAPGAAASTPKVLTSTNTTATALSLAGTYQPLLVSSSGTLSSDLVAFSGTVTLNSATSVLAPNDSAYAPIAKAGDTFLIMDGVSGTGSTSALTGSFSNAPISGSTFTAASGIIYMVQYDVTGLIDAGGTGQDVVLTVQSVPEPGSLGLLALGALGLLARRRRRAPRK